MRGLLGRGDGKRIEYGGYEVKVVSFNVGGFGGF